MKENSPYGAPKTSTIITSNGNQKPVKHKGAPLPALRIVDAIVLITGIVVGAGIFRTPSVVAANTPDGYWFLGVWIVGGIVSLIGALCYSELSTTFPSVGGDYHFLKIAFGKRFSFLFAWARATVIQTGSIALLAYIIGDYLSQLLPLGNFGPAIYAGCIVVLLTLINILGIQFGTGVQKFLTVLQFAGIFVLIGIGLSYPPAESLRQPLNSTESGPPALGMALIFVLLTFGGWNEAAYISSELKTGSKKMSFVLITSLLVITTIYLLLNLAFLKILGLNGIANSTAIGVDMMQRTVGESGVVMIGLLVALAALTSLNSTIFTGARANYALGKDFSVFSFLAIWHGKKLTPVNSLAIQGCIALLLIVFGAFTRDGFESMVDFTAPVFWFFFLCTGLALFVLRKKFPQKVRPFKVPFYPLTPVLFIMASGYLLYSSLLYAGTGALVGIAVLLAGMVFFLAINKSHKNV